MTIDRSTSRWIMWTCIIALCSVLAFTACGVNDHLAVAAVQSAADGNLRRLQMVMRLRPGVLHLREPGGFTLLGIATTNGHESIVSFLLQKGAEIDEADNYGLTPLRYAVQTMNMRMIRFLLMKGADPNALDSLQFTPMQAAVAVGRKDIWDEMRIHGGRPRSMLHAAASFGDMRGVREEVLRNPRDVNSSEMFCTPVDYAALHAHPEVLAFLLSHGGLITESALTEAVRSGNIECVKLLVSHGANPHRAYSHGVEMRSPLQVAAECGQTAAVRYLISLGVDVNYHDGPKSALQLARENGHSDIVTLLESMNAR